jgi:hypothetical protein
MHYVPPLLTMSIAASLPAMLSAQLLLLLLLLLLQAPGCKTPAAFSSSTTSTAQAQAVATQQPLHNQPKQRKPQQKQCNCAGATVNAYVVVADPMSLVAVVHTTV